jgi:hypothetical protein
VLSATLDICCVLASVAANVSVGAAEFEQATTATNVTAITPPINSFLRLFNVFMINLMLRRTKRLALNLLGQYGRPYRQMKCGN